MKKIFCIILIIVCFTSYGYLYTQTADVNGKDFNTPEKTIEYFVDALKENNIAKAFEACAINEYSEKYNFTAFSKRLNAMILHQSLAPSEYPMFVELNKLERTYRVIMQIKFFCYCMLSSEKVDGLVIGNPGDERIAAFIASADPSRLKNLKIIDTSFAAPRLKNNERLVKTFTEQAQIFGADEKTELIVLYKLENKYYLGGFSLLRYGKIWKIESLASSLANISPVEVIKESSLSEFEALISE